MRSKRKKKWRHVVGTKLISELPTIFFSVKLRNNGVFSYGIMVLLWVWKIIKDFFKDWNPNLWLAFQINVTEIWKRDFCKLLYNISKNRCIINTSMYIFFEKCSLFTTDIYDISNCFRFTLYRQIFLFFLRHVAHFPDEFLRLCYK